MHAYIWLHLFSQHVTHMSTCNTCAQPRPVYTGGNTDLKHKQPWTKMGLRYVRNNNRRHAWDNH